MAVNSLRIASHFALGAMGDLLLNYDDRIARSTVRSVVLEVRVLRIHSIWAKRDQRSTEKERGSELLASEERQVASRLIKRGIDIGFDVLGFSVHLIFDLKLVYDLA